MTTTNSTYVGAQRGMRDRCAMARQRLRGLVGSYPQRLDLGEQLAELYRREGILSHAGRWSFLSETRDPWPVIGILCGC